MVTVSIADLHALSKATIIITLLLLFIVTVIVTVTVRQTYHIFGKFTARQVFDIFMLGVNDFCQFPPFNHLLIHIHWNFTNKLFGSRQHIVADNLCNNRAPVNDTQQTVKTLRTYSYST